MFDVDGRDLLTLGRVCSLKQDYPEALRSFQEALEFLASEGGMAVHPQFLSHYGAALASVAGRMEEGRKLCERSIQLEPYEAEHYLNLCLVHEMSGNRGAAFGALDRGLGLHPGHPRLLAQRRKLDRRLLLPIPLLPRDHPLNRCLGSIVRAVRTCTRK